MPWPWQRKQSVPFGPDFTIQAVALEDPSANEDAYYTIPFNQYGQLIAISLAFTPGALPPVQYGFLESFRGSDRLYRTRISAPGSIVGTTRTSGMVTLGRIQDRNVNHWGTLELGDYWYLYPFDTVHVGVTTQGARSCNITDVQLTFMIWETL